MDEADAAPPAVLSLSDIAALAGVQRPVVSLWRRRTHLRGRPAPFPAVVDVVDGSERFALDDVVAYLASTGRGKNRDAALDAPTIAAPVTARHDDALTLLCLGQTTGSDLAGSRSGELTALAEQVDPGDRFLWREVSSRTWAPELLQYVDELRAGSFGGGDALRRLDAGPLARRLRDRVGSPDLTAAVAAVADACGAHLAAAAEGPPVLDPGTEQFLPDPEGSPFRDVRVLGDGSGDRSLWRRALLAGWSVVSAPGGAPAAKIASVVGDAANEALRRIDDVVLGLRPHDAAIVVGPASLLTDALTGDAEHYRASILRPGSLVAALRLPRGWSREAHQQNLALWVLGGGSTNGAVRLADLEGARLDLADLAADVTAALARTDARGYRYLRYRPLAPILAGGPLVPRGTRAVRFNVAEGDAQLHRVREAARRVADPVEGLEVFVSGARSRVLLRERSLGELAEARMLALRRGVRIDPACHDAHGTVTVWTATGAGAVRLDPFDAAARYPRAVRTEPGDVVFQEKPQMQAAVDPVGGALVATPARVLRLAAHAAIGPHLLADRINRTRPGAQWHTVGVPDLPGNDAQALEATLAAIALHRAALLDRLSVIDDLATALVEGVAAGTLAVHSESERPPRPVTHEPSIAPPPSLEECR